MLVIAKTSLAALVDGFNEFAGPLSFAPSDITKFSPSRDGWPLLGGEDDEWAFLFESHDTHLAMMYTPLLQVSRKLQTQVMSFRVEHTSGSVEFFFAEHGEIRRIFLKRSEGFTKPYSGGVAMASETDVPIDEALGFGLNAILQSIGLGCMDFSVAFQPDSEDQTLFSR